MGQSINSGTVTVNGSVTTSGLGFPALGTGQTPVNASITNFDATLKTVYTVSAGKTFYLTSLTVAATTGLGSEYTIQIFDNAAVIGVLNIGVAHQGDNLKLSNPIPLAATHVLKSQANSSLAGGSVLVANGYEV